MENLGIVSRFSLRQLINKFLLLCRPPGGAFMSCVVQECSVTDFLVSSVLTAT